MSGAADPIVQKRREIKSLRAKIIYRWKRSHDPNVKLKDPWTAFRWGGECAEMMERVKVLKKELRLAVHLRKHGGESA